MRRLLLTFFFFASAILAFSQHTDIVKLHSSEIVRGTITEEIPGEQLTILTLPDSVLRIIPFTDIEKVIYKKDTSAIYKSADVSKNPDKSNGGQATFKGYLRTGYGSQLREDEEFVSNSFFKADLILGASFSDKFSLGLGIGARVGENDHTLMPLFIDMRFTPGLGVLSPMFALSGGVSFQLGDDYDVEKFLNPEIGIRIGKPSKTNLILAVGLEMMDYVTDRKEPEAALFQTLYTGTTHYDGYSVSVLLGF